MKSNRTARPNLQLTSLQIIQDAFVTSHALRWLPAPPSLLVPVLLLLLLLRHSQRPWEGTSTLRNLAPALRREFACENVTIRLRKKTPPA